MIILVNGGDHPTSKMARYLMGFFVAVAWIMAIADEVVNVLKAGPDNLSPSDSSSPNIFQAFGFIFGLSDAIIGLTIFPMGNSVADLVDKPGVSFLIILACLLGIRSHRGILRLFRKPDVEHTPGASVFLVRSR